MFERAGSLVCVVINSLTNDLLSRFSVEREPDSPQAGPEAVCADHWATSRFWGLVIAVVETALRHWVGGHVPKHVYLHLLCELTRRFRDRKAVDCS